jgi:hypothetical protein
LLGEEIETGKTTRCHRRVHAEKSTVADVELVMGVFESQSGEIFPRQDGPLMGDLDNAAPGAQLGLQ